MSALVVRDLHFTYPGWPPTLKGASIDVPAGKSATTELRTVNGDVGQEPGVPHVEARLWPRGETESLARGRLAT
ncbi:MAG: hypothetical protein ABR562_08865, partial [Thermoplasmatota archaeon]